MIEVKNLEKSYDKNVVKDLSFHLEQGDIIVVMGESGVGKTTLLRLLLGLETKDAGSIRMDDDNISVVFQEDRLLEQFDIVDNIRLVSGISKESIFEEYKKILPKDAFYKKIRDYSGGMKRRAAILRAVLYDSSAIFMDEPFKGLDYESKQKTMQFVLDNRKGRTLILVTHDADEAEFFHPDKIITLA